MSIEHLFDNPLTRQRAETGAEREALLRRLGEQQKTISTLQGRVDQLVGEVSRLQAEKMGDSPAPKPKSIGKAAAPYIEAMRALGRPATSREISESMGKTPAAFYLWWKDKGPAAGVAIHSYVQIRGRDVPLYCIM